MIIFPAIDIKGGECVRLLKGDFSKVTKYKKSPLDQATEFSQMGFKNIHIIDLDGAIEKNPINKDIISMPVYFATSDKLIDDSRYFYNPFHRKGKRFDLVFWPEVKKGTAKGGWYETRIPDMRPNAPNPTLTFKYPQIGRKEDNFKRDPNTGQIITEKLPPDKDGFQKTIRREGKMPARSKGGQMNPSTRKECYLQLLVYEPVKNKRGELETGKFLIFHVITSILFQWCMDMPLRNSILHIDGSNSVCEGILEKMHNENRGSRAMKPVTFHKANCYNEP